MKNKKPLIFLALAILFALVVLTLERPETPRVDSVDESYFLPGFDSAKVARIDVLQIIDGTEIYREGDSWMVKSILTPAKQSLNDKEGVAAPEEKSFPADAARVNSAIGIFTGLTKGTVASDNPEKKDIYQVGVTGTTVKLFDNADKPIGEFVIGKNGPDFTSSYVRFNGEDDVFLVNRSLGGLFSARTNDWRDKTIFAFDPAAITDINVKIVKNEYAISRKKGGEWKSTVPEGIELDAASVQKLVGKVAKLNAVDFADGIDDIKAGLDAPEYTITVVDSNGAASKLIIGKEENAKRKFAKLSGKEQIYLLPEGFVESLPASLEKKN